MRPAMSRGGTRGECVKAGVKTASRFSKESKERKQVTQTALWTTVLEAFFDSRKTERTLFFDWQSVDYQLQYCNYQL